MDEDMIEAFLALRDLVVKLQFEQVEALRSMQEAISKLAERAADQEGRLDVLQGQVEALLSALQDQDPGRRMN